MASPKHIRDMSEKIFNDPIHGHFKLPSLCVKIIDTPQFQRLRSIKQLGGTYFVYPGAAHNRFEHSLGVCYLAGKLASTLKERQRDLNITENDVLCVQIAGLCHDLGQGPFSRMFEDEFLPMFYDHKQYTHESLSLLMFDHLLNENKELKDEFAECGLNDEDIQFIKEQIQGSHKKEKKWQYKGRPQEKSFLYEIVANKRNGIDVDKWDYLARDCHMLGIKSNFDHMRCIEYAKVLMSEGERQLCFRRKEAENLCDMFYIRYTLHRRAYQHIVGDIIETMIAEAMWKANDIITITGKGGKRLTLSETVTDMKAYEKMTDFIIEKILLSKKPNLKESQEILRKVQKRELYKFVGSMASKLSDQTTMTLEDYIKEEERSYLTLLLKRDSTWKTDEFIIHFVSLDYGMEDENPIDHVRFFYKGNPDIAVKVKKEEVSSLFPCKSSEHQLRFYCKRENEKSRKDAETALEELMLQ